MRRIDSGFSPREGVEVRVLFRHSHNDLPFYSFPIRRWLAFEHVPRFLLRFAFTESKKTFGLLANLD